MRKIVVLLIIGLIFILSGCDGKSPVNQKAKNGNGTPAVNLPESSDKTIAEEPDISEVPIQSSEEFNVNEMRTQNYEELNVSETPIQTSEKPDVNEQPENNDIIEIKEKMFIAQTNDIYFNPVDYLGKTIKYEGIFNVYEALETGARYYSVIRYGPGCCGDDAYAGFEVIWDKDYPQQEDWVEAIGILKEYEENGYQYLRLELSSLTVLPTRGEEYVSQ